MWRHACHSSRCVAERDPPFDRQAAIERLFRDIDEAKRLAFEKEDDTGRPMPDLTALPKILELQAKVYGLLKPDGKSAGGDVGNVEVPLERIEKLVAAAKLKKEANGQE